MSMLIGIVLVVFMVFGGYMVSGGQLGVVLHALPTEFMIIGGSALGAYLIANDFSGSMRSLKDLRKAISGVRWKEADYQDLLILLHGLLKIARQDPVALETHLDAPEDSALFGAYPNILKDHDAVSIICDTLRSGSLNFDDPHQVEDLLEKRLELREEDAMHTAHALQTLADGLPALGIVAAVLGVIKTMSSIDQPPPVLGKMIGSALVGTFLGVFLAYGIIGPIASRLRRIEQSDAHFYHLIRDVLVSNLHRHQISMCIEVGRQNTPAEIRPSFATLESSLRNRKEAA